MFYSPRFVASLRLFFVLCLSLSNLSSLWSALRTQRDKKKRSLKGLSLICILLVNLFYLSFIWTPFTVSTFRHFVTDQTGVEDAQATITFFDSKEPSTQDSILSNSSKGRVTRWAKEDASFAEGHKGTWSLVFPVTSGYVEKKPLVETRHVKVVNTFPSYIAADCTLQDIITSGAVYSLSFICVIKLILTKRPVLLQTSSYTFAWFGFLLTGVPILTTLVIRYGEHLGANFALHQPDKIASGYILYNIICDVHIDETYVFLSFLEWAGLIMILFVSVTMVLGFSVKTEEPNENKEQKLKDKTSILERLSFIAGEWIRDWTLSVATLWAWPLKPAVILLLYVWYGRHWTNVVSWISHMIMVVSTVFLPLSSLFSNGHQHQSSDTDSEKASRSKASSFPKIILTSSDLKPPSYEDVTLRKDNFTYVTLSEDEDEPSLVSAVDIRNNIQENCDSNQKLSFLPSSKPSRMTTGDEKIILQQGDDVTEGGSLNTSEV